MHLSGMINFHFHFHQRLTCTLKNLRLWFFPDFLPYINIFLQKQNYVLTSKEKVYLDVVAVNSLHIFNYSLSDDEYHSWYIDRMMSLRAISLYIEKHYK